VSQRERTELPERSIRYQERGRRELRGRRTVVTTDSARFFEDEIHQLHACSSPSSSAQEGEPNPGAQVSKKSPRRSGERCPNLRQSALSALTALTALATLLAALASGLLLLLAGLLLPAAALLSALSRLLAALVLTTLTALTALVLILISHFRFTPNTG
jgi:hypothetical protein